MSVSQTDSKIGINRNNNREKERETTGGKTREEAGQYLSRDKNKAVTKKGRDKRDDSLPHIQAKECDYDDDQGSN